MKVCVIFRGDHVREATHVRKYIDILMCWDNLKKTIYDDLTNNGHECDIVFITYCSKIVEDIKNIIAPTHIEIKERINQSENFKNVLRKVCHLRDRSIWEVFQWIYTNL
jgi:hypothetical protein